MTDPVDRDGRGYLPQPRVARERYRVTPMTLWRWRHNPALAFPAPISINGRKYYAIAELDAFDAARAAAAPTGSAAQPVARTATAADQAAGAAA